LHAQVSACLAGVCAPETKLENRENKLGVVAFGAGAPRERKREKARAPRP